MIELLKPIETEKINHFPISVFPENVQNYINQMNNTLNYSKDFMSCSLIFAISAINGNKYKLKVKNGWIAPSIFWFAIVGEPGTMKSHPVHEFIKPLHDIDKISKGYFDSDVGRWESEGSKGRKPQFKQIIVNDYTLEALHEIHSFNKRGIGLYKDELVGFLNDMNKYRKGSDEQFWLESFNNKSYIINRVTKDPKLIDNININLIGTIQPSVLAKVAKQYDGNGLIDRFLYTSAEKEIYPINNKDVDLDLLEWYNKKLNKFEDENIYIDIEDTVILRFTEEAFNRYIEIDEEIVNIQRSESESKSICNYLSKMKSYMPRFCLILSLIDKVFDGKEFEITEKYVDDSWLICKYFVNSAKEIFTDAELSEEMSNILSCKKGLTKKEQVLELSKKGYNNTNIAKIMNCSAQYVGKLIKKVN